MTLDRNLSLDVLRMIVNGKVRCPICGAGWTITKATNLALIAETVEAHIKQHKRIKAERR